MIAPPPALPSVVSARSAYHAGLVAEVAAAVSTNRVVIVGVAGLQPGKLARRLLDEQKIVYAYLEYGSYFSGWRRRLALKIWAGWPTFPLVFVRGTFIGGASDLKKLIDSGELMKLLEG